jgi:hypothetical protein
MSSIRNSNFARRSLAVLAIAGLLPAVTGCNLKYKRPVEAANDEIVPDEAMAIRTWPQQDADFANSTLEAYKNRFPYNYQTTQDQRTDQGYIASSLAFVVQAVVLPFTFIKNPPGTKERFSTLTYEPSYTVNPSRPPLVEGISRMPQGGMPAEAGETK